MYVEDGSKENCVQVQQSRDYGLPPILTSRGRTKLRIAD